MSNRWPGGVIRKTPVTPAGPFQNGAASGVWSLADAAYWTKQGLWPLAGNTLAVEDVFSTYLYTGTGATQTITNGINLSGSGGMVWTKNRGRGTSGNLIDTVRGVTKKVVPSSTAAQATVSYMTSFGTTGYTINGNNDEMNLLADTYVGWTFREQPNFFDVVTYTGTGANRNIAHNLGSVPGMILVKRTDTAADWQVYHRSNANTQYMVLNSDAAVATGTTRWNSTTPTATEFTVGTDATVNASGGTYVAYLYAHDTSSTGLIQCGAAAAQTDINLGWEPQFVIIKKYDAAQIWIMNDNMRGMSVGGNTAADLYPNTADAEATGSNNIFISATGFKINLTQNYIYMAIRRGPMKTPTLGTSVFAPVLYTGTSAAGTISGASFPPDLVIPETRNTANNRSWFDRLRGRLAIIQTDNANAEIAAPSGSNTSISSFNMNGVSVGTDVYATINQSGYTYVNYFLGRAPGFFDEVCYTGTGVARTLNHNLGVVPELMIVKSRNAGEEWFVYSASLLATEYVNLNNALAKTGGAATTWNSTRPTASVFSVGTAYNTNGPYNYVAYLFASCPGVSKVGSYTGNGSSQTINCAFTTGARFVLIKRTDSTGDWYVWDSARGIVAGNDPYVRLNLADVEVTTNDSVDTDNTGFIVNQVAATNVNVSAATYIFLAIA